MKKFLLVFFAAVIVFSLHAGMASAAQCGVDHPDTSSAVLPGPNVPGHPEVANSIVPCGQYPDCTCEFSDLFVMIRKIYIFIAWTIAVPLMGLLIVVGGVIMIVSGGNPGLFDLGKRMLWGAAWGVMLIFGAWLIIKVIFLALGINIDPGIIIF